MKNSYEVRLYQEKLVVYLPNSFDIFAVIFLPLQLA